MFRAARDLAARAEAIYASVRLLEEDDRLYAPLVAVLPEHGLFVWWNGSCTYQMARRNEALFAARADRHVPVLAIWENHAAPARDEEVARRELAALASIEDAFEDISWNDAGAYEWARGRRSLGPVYIFPGGDLVDPEDEGDEA